MNFLKQAQSDGKIKHIGLSHVTVDQIKEAHSKVKSGADFPNYIQDLIKLGVTYYETFVKDGHTDYYGANDYTTSSEQKYDALTIAKISNIEQFKKDIKAHQQGKTDYPTFCNDCAVSGIEKWAVSMDKMTCTYYDVEENELLVEAISAEEISEAEEFFSDDEPSESDEDDAQSKDENNKEEK